MFTLYCDANLSHNNAQGIIKINLNTAASKGAIDVTEYEITDAIVTLTAPDATDETETWASGEETSLIFQN
ncbi:MAG: hypothetical protein JXR70_18415 [Spirochaetales bacterium]|nr:hypothetical protein [Spirochaetales bacterium]